MSGSAAQDPPPGPSPAVSNPPLCGTCRRDIHLPCGFWRLVDCPNCTGRIESCINCNGQGVRTYPRANGALRDCNACVGTGRMMRCHHCDGLVQETTRRRSAGPCRGCNGRLALRCMRCSATGAVWMFVRFCSGDGFNTENVRRHPLSTGIPRERWGRVQE